MQLFINRIPDVLLNFHFRISFVRWQTVYARTHLTPAISAGVCACAWVCPEQFPRSLQTPLYSICFPKDWVIVDGSLDSTVFRTSRGAPHNFEYFVSGCVNSTCLRMSRRVVFSCDWVTRKMRCDKYILIHSLLEIIQSNRFCFEWIKYYTWDRAHALGNSVIRDRARI